MNMHIKVFSGSQILANRLSQLLDEIEVPYLVKDNKEAGRVAGFGTLGNSVDVYIYESDLEKAQSTIDDFKQEIEADK
ncbi:MULTISPECIES: putative signal transducing protein [Tenacibaculum]|uniref:DUF2007 domain-containing protein n=1 Tax=Tenacibaculum discolor TaxID=361581 RepID=A0A2G1BU78_9FLAO|nr:MULTISPECIES: DUF2007 domain-containing protein [Tenacibaculum]MDP2542076.1 DUF2007 domain-containing protein [Tenacibaculum discolor]NVK08078.1 DUF2007 domain-containing protein [Tenacibaculum sp.]PHN97514.1 hypothetical protein CSC81_07965 [Tenacibaculum discolor]RLK06726.1 putative signal transducing protein [Tenacibaculum discolor]